jgi:hypothetical protein
LGAASSASAGKLARTTIEPSVVAELLIIDMKDYWA